MALTQHLFIDFHFVFSLTTHTHTSAAPCPRFEQLRERLAPNEMKFPLCKSNIFPWNLWRALNFPCHIISTPRRLWRNKAYEAKDKLSLCVWTLTWRWERKTDSTAPSSLRCENSLSLHLFTCSSGSIWCNFSPAFFLSFLSLAPKKTNHLAVERSIRSNNPRERKTVLKKRCFVPLVKGKVIENKH